MKILLLQNVTLVALFSLAISLNRTVAQACPGGYEPSPTNFLFNGNFSVQGGPLGGGIDCGQNPAVAAGTLNTTSGFYSQAAHCTDGAANRAFDGCAGSNRNQYNLMTGDFPLNNFGFNDRLNDFPGDPANNVAASSTFFYSNGNCFNGGEYLLWGQQVNGLVIGRTYTFFSYINNAIEPPGAPHDPVVRLRVGGAVNLPNGTVVAGPLTVTEALTAFAQPLEGWVRLAYTFTATSTSEIFKVTSASPGANGDDFQFTGVGVSLCRPLVTASSNSPVCPGATLTLSASTPAAGTFTYSWSGPNGFTATGATPTRANFSLADLGTYTVTITDANGVTNTASTVVAATAAPAVSIAGATTVCAGQFSVFTAGGALTYLWSNGATTAGIAVSVAGTYTVTGTAANGCTASANRTLTVNPSPVVSIAGTNAICSGNSTTFTATGASTYLWSTGATTAAITINTAGTYTVTGTSAAGCTATANRSLVVTLSPTASISGPVGICTGNTATYTAIGGGTYLWSTGATTASITLNTAGTYTVTVTLNGCTATASRSLTINANPTVNITGNTSFCPGGSTTLTASGGTAYLWSNGATTAAIIINGPNAYTVTVTNAAGCSSSASRLVTLLTPPTVAISGTNTICAGASSTFTASGASTYLWSTGATTAAISVSVAGTYTVTGTNAAGCTATDIRVLTVNPLPIATISGTSVICTGGSSTFTASGGGTYAWSTGATTAAISVNTAGTYNVTVTLAGCTATASRTLTINTNPTIVVAGTNTICAGATSTFTASGGSTYVWNTGATTAAIIVNAAGTYTVTGTNAAGCSATASQALTVNPLPTAAITGANTICGGASTAFTATGGGTYLWSTGATTATINVSIAGTYTVTVTLAGCTATANRVLNVTANPTVSITGAAAICAGGSSTFTANGATTYAWSTGATTASINVSIAGTYTVTGTIAGGCTAASSQTLVLNPLPVAAITGTNTICTGGNATFTATGGGTYLWSTGATTAAISVNTAGVYAVTVTLNGCTATANRTLTINTAPSVSIAGTNTICAGASTTFTASGAASYSWSTGATVATISLNTAGTYIVTGTAANGCTASASQVLAVNALPNVTISGTNTICAGNSTTFAGNGATAYVWSTGATTATITINTAGTYTVTGTNANGCTATSSRVLTVNPLPIAAITGTNSVCTGVTSTFTASGGGTYAWSTGATTTSIVVNTAGTYNVTVTTGGCTASASRTFTINPNPSVAIAGNNTICAGNSTTFTVSGATNYIWSNGATTASVTLNIAGTYTVTGSFATGCSATASRTLTVNPNPTVTVSGPGPICIGTTATLTATGGGTYLWSTGATTNAISTLAGGTYTVTVTNNGCSTTANRVLTVNFSPNLSITGQAVVCAGGGTVFTALGATTYLWNTGATTASISANVSGTYTVTGTNANGCSAIASTGLLVNNAPVISSNSPICLGQTIQLYASGGTAYAWSGPGGFTSAAQNPTRPNATGAMSGTYTVTVTSNGGCTASASLLFVINNGTPPTASVVGPGIVCRGATINLVATGGGSYAWSGPNGFTGSGANLSLPNAVQSMSGPYNVTVTNGGCTASASVTVGVNPVVTIAANTSVCVGGTLNLTASGGGTYAWAGPNGFTSTSATPTITNVTAANAGLYQVTVTLAGCTDVGQVAVSIGCEICNNTLDDDGDGLADCLDPDCPACALNFSCNTGSPEIYYMPPIWGTGENNFALFAPQDLVLSTDFPTALVNIRTPNNAYNQTVSLQAGVAQLLNIPATNAAMYVQSSTLNTPELGKGLIITSNVPIQATYRLTASLNQDIMPLKGKAALGHSFYCGSQTRLSGGPGGDERHFIGVMAVENNTVVTINSPVPLQGIASFPHTFTLQAGETYLMTTVPGSSVSISGARVTSTRPIVVNCGSQHNPQPYSGNRDAGMDQIIPTNLTGQDYVAVHGPNATSNSDYIIVVGIENNTSVTINGVFQTTIGPGGVFTWNMPNGANVPYYIRTSQKAYIYHVSSYAANEFGMAILPPINPCIGSRRVTFFRTTAASLDQAIVLIPTVGLSTLTYRGLTWSVFGTSYPITNFPGYSAVVFPNSAINASPTAQNEIVCTNARFHAGVVSNTGGAATGNYGYYSDYDAQVEVQDPLSGLPTNNYFVANVTPGVPFQHCLNLSGCGNFNFVSGIVNGPSTQSSSFTNNCVTYTMQPNALPCVSDTIRVEVQNNLGIRGYACLVFRNLFNDLSIQNFSPSPAIFCPGQSVNLTVNATSSGGFSLGTFLWTAPGGQTLVGTTIPANQVGAYTVTVTDNNTCTASSTVNVTQGNVVGLANNMGVTCPGGSIFLTSSPSGGNPPYAFQWTGPGGFTSTQANPIRTNATAAMGGTYTLVVQDAAGCTNTSSTVAVIGSSPVPSISDGGGSPYCVGESISLTTNIAGGAAPFTYAWNGPLGFVGGLPNPTFPSAVLGNQGNYSVTVTSANGCTASAGRFLAVNPAPNVNITGANFLCSGTSTPLTASGAGTYLWNTGGNAVVLPVNSAGNYTVTGTDANGCSASALKVMAWENTPPTIICPPSIFASLTNLNYTLPDFTAAATVADNCPGPLPVAQTPAPGTVYNVSQTIPVTLTVTDVSGNTASCSFAVNLTLNPCGIIYVDSTATGANNGTSWANAFVNMQLAFAVADSYCDTIFAAKGTYWPSHSGRRDTAFMLIPYVPVYGGFPNGGAPFAQRNPQLYPTVLSGEIGAPNSLADNSYRVVWGKNLGPVDPQNSVFDGFVITRADGNGTGGGLYLSADTLPNTCGLLVRNCQFVENRALTNGGGMAILVNNAASADVEVSNCLFKGNTSFVSGGGLFAAPQLGSTLNLQVTNCLFANNIANDPLGTGRGGGLCLVSSGNNSLLTANLDSLSFAGNATSDNGGGFYAWGRTGGTLNYTLSNSGFTANTAPDNGGGMVSQTTSGLLNGTVYQVTFTGNTAYTGGGAHNHSENAGGNLTVSYQRCLFANNATTHFGGAADAYAVKNGLAQVGFSACRFETNTAGRRGGALYFSSKFRSPLMNTALTANVDNCVLLSNTATGPGSIVGQGGAVFLLGSGRAFLTVNLRHSTLYNNTAEQGGGAYHLGATNTPSVLNVQNCIAWRNITVLVKSKMFHTFHVAATTNMRSSFLSGTDFAGNTVGTGLSVDQGGMLYGDPLFANTAQGNLQLTAGSPCINTANPLLGLPTDFDGTARPQGGGWDMGAYEYNGQLRPLVRAPETGTDTPPLEMQLFPNPNMGYFTIAFDREMTGALQVFDIQGKLVLSEALLGENRRELNLSEEASGVYLVRVTCGGEVLTQRVVVSKP